MSGLLVGGETLAPLAGYRPKAAAVHLIVGGEQNRRRGLGMATDEAAVSERQTAGQRTPAARAHVVSYLGFPVGSRGDVVCGCASGYRRVSRSWMRLA